MNNEESYSKKLKGNKVFIDHFVLLNAHSADLAKRQNNLCFFFITSIAYKWLELFTTDYCLGDTRENREDIIQVVFEENSNVLFECIKMPFSLYNFPDPLVGNKQAHINVSDATILGCNYLLTLKPEFYRGTDSGVEILTPLDFLHLVELQ